MKKHCWIWDKASLSKVVFKAFKCEKDKWDSWMAKWSRISWVTLWQVCLNNDPMHLKDKDCKVRGFFLAGILISRKKFANASSYSCWKLTRITRKLAKKLSTKESLRFTTFPTSMTFEKFWCKKLKINRYQCWI